jgi:hypothetical protein
MSAALAIAAVLWCATSEGSPGAPPPLRSGRATLRLALDARGLSPAPAGDLALRPATLLAGEQARADTGASGPDVSSQRALRTWERRLEWSTAGALVVTSTLGTLVAINQPTAFGDGRCQTGGPVFGDYGCNRGLSTLHGVSGVVSTTLYTAHFVLGLREPVQVRAAVRPWHRALTWVHRSGIVLQPLLGLVAAFPQVVGVNNTAPGDPFPRNVRTAHVALGYVITAAFLTTLALEI